MFRGSVLYWREVNGFGFGFGFGFRVSRLGSSQHYKC